MRRTVSNTFETVRYWAGQKLLHSRFHPLYLKLSGKEPKPQTYEQWLSGERHGEVVELDGSRYELVLAPGVTVAPDAAYWLMREAERTGADCVYADEDQIDAHGRRHSPVFRPAWSPELAIHCDYIGGSFLRCKNGKSGSWARVPRILFHRKDAPVFTQNADVCPPPHVDALTSVIVCSRNPQLLDSCFAALHARSAGAVLELIAVLHMNQGQDEALLQAAAKHGARAVRYSDAFHFGRMCNLGVRESSGGFLLFLNDDVTPLDDHYWLRWMLAQAQRPKTGAVGAMLYFPDGRIQHAGVLIGTPNGAGHPGRLSHGSPLWPWLTMTREVSAVTGACLLMPRGVFSEIGEFDEIFPVNYNDVDLCLRAGQKGYRIVLEARARLEHAESATRAIGIRYAERQRFLDRWAGILRHGDSYFNPNLTDNELLLPDPEAHMRID